jgi:hypothetical protein
VDAGPFSILAPSGWELHQLTGVDSYVGEFVGDGVALTFDFGRYSSSPNQAMKPDYVIAKESIGGANVFPGLPCFRFAGAANFLDLR